MVGLNRDEILIRKINVVVGCDPHGLGVSNSHYSALLRVCVCVCVCGARNIDQAEKRMTLSLCILMTIGDQRILLKYFSVYHWSCNCPDYQCFCASALFLLIFCLTISETNSMNSNISKICPGTTKYYHL